MSNQKVITAIRLKNEDGTYSDELPIGTSTDKVDYDNDNTLNDVLGNVDILNKGDIQNQINDLDDTIDDISITVTTEMKEDILEQVLDEYPLIDNVPIAPYDFPASDQGKVVQNGDLVSQTSLSVTQNNTYNTTTKNQVVVNVPNTYVAGDEGKVVQNGDLVTQTSLTVAANGTYDTTTKNSVIVNIPDGDLMDF